MAEVTTPHNSFVISRFNNLVETLHLVAQVTIDGIKIYPDREHYPEYAEGATLGCFDTFEEALGFLRGWVACQDYFRMGKGIRD